MEAEERHKFIIPDLRRASQPGLEAVIQPSSSAEQDVSQLEQQRQRQRQSSRDKPLPVPSAPEVVPSPPPAGLEAVYLHNPDSSLPQAVLPSSSASASPSQQHQQHHGSPPSQSYGAQVPPSPYPHSAAASTTASSLAVSGLHLRTGVHRVGGGGVGGGGGLGGGDESRLLEHFKLEDGTSVPPPFSPSDGGGAGGGPGGRYGARRGDGARDGGDGRRTILGLSVGRFWAAVAGLTVVVAAALAVGLALGISRMTSPNSTASSGVTPTIQIQGQPSAAPINPLCPSGNGSVVTPLDASGSDIEFNNNEPMRFTVLCDTFWPARAGVNPALRDIMVAYAPDLVACMTLCAQYNQGYSDAVGDDVRVGAGICVAVSLVKLPAEFCYLKNATGVNDTSSKAPDKMTATGGGFVDSALLVGNWSRLSESQLIQAFGGHVNGT